MELFGFEIFWYCIIFIALMAFSILDGFDLGVGIVHLTARTDEERRMHLNAIGPVWDGNAVWLIILSGGLLAGFPGAFGVMFSSFYDLMMILLAGIMFRAVAIEFRSKRPSKLWRNTWDFLFFFASLVITFVVGLLLGNLVTGIPLDAQGNFTGNFASYFSVYTIVIAVSAVSAFMMHGSLFLLLKTEGELHRRLSKQAKLYIAFFVFMYFLVTIMTFIYKSHMIGNFFNKPWLFVFPLISILLVLNIPREISKDRSGFAFISSCLSIIFLFVLFGLGQFPYIIRSTINTLENSLSIHNSAASTYTLFILMIIVIIGVPLVLAYSFWIYRIFREKVKLDSNSY